MNTWAEPSRVVLHPAHAPGLDEALRQVDGILLNTPLDDDGVVTALEAGADILITYVWDNRFITDGLRWLQTMSAGLDQFPLDALAARDIRLSSARGAHAPAVAEHAVALLLALVRGLGPAVRGSATREWTARPAFEVSGRTLGILGLGTIGEAVAVRAHGLGMRVIGTKSAPESYRGVADRVFGPDQTLEVCQEADAVVVALPRSRETTGLIGKRELAALEGGWLVNVGRGSVVDEPALIAALSSGTLRGAGLDVFTVEPLPASSPLWDMPTVVITPHSAWSSDRLAERLVQLFEKNLSAYRGQAEWATLIL